MSHRKKATIRFTRERLASMSSEEVRALEAAWPPAGDGEATVWVDESTCWISNEVAITIEGDRHIIEPAIAALMDIARPPLSPPQGQQ